MTPAQMGDICTLAQDECATMSAEIQTQTQEIRKQRTAIAALGETIANLRARIESYALETQRLRNERTPSNVHSHELCSRSQRSEAHR